MPFLDWMIRNAARNHFHQWQFGVLKDRSDPYRELVFALVALEQFAGGDLADLLRLTFGAFHTVRPTQLRKSLYALVLSAVFLNQFADVHSHKIYGEGVTDLTENSPSDKEKQEIPATELDDESLFDRLFPDELIDWVKGLFGGDEEE